MKPEQLLFKWIQSWGKEDNYKDWEDFCQREELSIIHKQDLEEFAEFCAKKLSQQSQEIAKGDVK